MLIRCFICKASQLFTTVGIIAIPIQQMRKQAKIKNLLKVPQLVHSRAIF